MVRRLNPLTICRPIVENKRYYAPTTLESIIECPRRRHLQKTFNKKLTWPDFAKGTHLHRKIAELRTHHLRHLKGKKKRYGSAEAFANVVANDWQRMPINQGMIDKNKILWDETLPNQPYILKSEIREIALRIYPILMAELETVIIFANKTQKGALSIRTAYNFEFIYKGRGFTGEIDEIRKEKNKIIIRDYKSGKWSFIEKKQGYAHQPTEYTFAICYEALVNEQFRKAIDISLEQAQSWITRPELMSENIEFEYFMLDICKEWDKEKKEYLKVDKNHIIKVQRNEFNYKELCLGINMAEALLIDMQDQSYYTPIKEDHCKRCFYRKECDDMTQKTDVHLKQATFNEYFKNRTRQFISLEELKNYSPLKKDLKQTEFDFVKEIKKQQVKNKSQ